MDRSQPSESERFSPMRAGRLGAIELLLRADLRERTESVAASPARRALHTLPVLRQPAYAGGVEARCRVWHQPQTHSTVNGRSRASGNSSEAASEPSGARPRDPSVSAARCRNPFGKPRLEQRYYVCSAARWLRLPGCCHRLVQPLRPELGGLEHRRCVAVPRGSRRRFGDECTAGNLQHRSRLAVHQSAVSGAAEGPPDPNQYGRPRPCARQCFHRTSLAHGQVRVHLPARARVARRSAPRTPAFFLRIQFPAAPSSAPISHARRSLLRNPEEKRKMTFLTWGSAPNPGIYRFWARIL